MPPSKKEITLPCDIPTEKLVLGAILNGSAQYASVREILESADFSLESHRRIFGRMGELAARGIPPDRITVANELRAWGQLDSISEGGAGGLSYLVSLDQGLPDIPQVAHYCNILKDKSLERLVYALNKKVARGIVTTGAGGDIRQTIDAMAAEVQRLQDMATKGQREADGETPAQIIENYPGGASAFLDPSQRPKGLFTGFTKLDEVTGGLFGGQVIVIAGRTSSGKTSFAHNILDYLAFSDPAVPSAIFTFEMPAASVLNRMVSSRANVAQFRIKNNFIHAEERRRMQIAMHQISEAPLYVYGKSSRTIEDVSSKLRRAVKERGVKLAAIDHLGLFSSERLEHLPRVQQVAYWTRRIKLLAMDLDIPILLLAQLNRPQKQFVGKKPSLEDLRDSATVEQDADIVMFVWREWLFRRDREDLKHKAELLIEKHRDGEVCSIPLKFIPHLTKFCNPDEDDPVE